VCHRTVSGAPGTIQSELLGFGFLQAHSTIIHRTVRCTKRSNGYQRNGRVHSALTELQFAAEVRAGTRGAPDSAQYLSGAPRCQSSNDRNRHNPNGWVTWLAHRTVRCAHRQQPSPTAVLVVGAINTPQPPLFKESMFLAICIQYKSSRLYSKTQNKRSNPLLVPNSFQILSGL
jgi:hypothetical protein